MIEQVAVLVLIVVMVGITIYSRKEGREQEERFPGDREEDQGVEG